MRLFTNAGTTFFNLFGKTTSYFTFLLYKIINTPYVHFRSSPPLYPHPLLSLHTQIFYITSPFGIPHFEIRHILSAKLAVSRLFPTSSSTSCFVGNLPFFRKSITNKKLVLKQDTTRKQIKITVPQVRESLRKGNN